MTAYTDFVSDFPSRCLKLLDLHLPESKRRGLEVTFLLSIAGSGLVIPVERLDEQHPLQDVQRHAEARTVFSGLLKQPFATSRLCGAHSGNWRMGTMNHHHGRDAWQRAADTWVDGPIQDHINVTCVVRCIRNALAHGNIQTKKCPTSKQIVEIALASAVTKGRGDTRKEVGIRHLTVTPAAFEFFLREWLSFLGREKLEPLDVSFELDRAA